MTVDGKFSLRTDLIRRSVWMGDQPVWVIKDPLSREFVYFSDQEFEILELADGNRSIAEMASTCAERFSPQYISTQALVRFFADASQRGLVVVNGVRAASGDLENTDRSWWRNPLAIRLPGINPDPVLDRITPAFKTLSSPVLGVLLALLWAIGFVIAMTNAEALGESLVTASRRLASGDGVIALLAVISLTKIIHELAHAIACKNFGGECRELGVMFLVGVPCLYCDVSDAWLLDRRWKRVLISSAGMLAEMSLAAIAAVLWMFATDGTVRDLCVTVMVVCSVSTILFNGNPLLRYDGYFILSDLAGIPNLAGEASAVIRGWMRRFLWATPVPRLSLVAGAWRRTCFVVSYGIASWIYRVAVYLFILLMLYRLADRYELGGLVGTLALFAIASRLLQWGKSILAPPHRSIRRASMTTRRPAIVACTVMLIGLILGLVPLPRSVVAPMSVRPAGAQSVFVTRGGAIADSLLSGVDVKAGDVLATQLNPEMGRELAAARSQCDRLAAELASLQRRRGTDRRASARIPTVEKALHEAAEQKNLLERDAERLTLRSPREGRIYAPPQRIPMTRDDRQPSFWTGTPMEEENRGAWLEAGTLLCLIGDPQSREAILLLRQQDVELIRPRQRVSLLLADRSPQNVQGQVVEVSATPLDELPVEFKSSNRIDFEGVESGQSPVYQVRVTLDRAAGSLPVRLTGLARIHVNHASVLSRLGRFLSDTFG